MARLPTAEDLGQRPIPNVRRTPRAPALDGAAEGIGYAGRRLTHLGDDIIRVNRIEEDRANTLRADDAYNGLIEKTLDLTEGEDGFKKQKGAAVATKAIAPDYWQRFEQSAREIEGNLVNDSQRNKFRGRAKVLGQQYRVDLKRHIEREAEAYGQQVYDNTKGMEERNAALRWNEPGAVDSSILRLNGAIDMRALDQGWDDETLTLERAKSLSGVHGSVVVSALDNDALDYADKYFKKVSPDLDETTRHRLSMAIDGKRKQLQAEQRQQRMEARLALQETVGDVTASYLSAGRYDGPIPNRQDFKAAYEGDEGAKRYEQFEKVLSVGTDIQAAALGNPQEQNELLRKWKPEPTVGFKGNQERYELLASSVSKLNKEREDDPARFVVSRLPQANAAYQRFVAAQDDPVAAQEYVRTVQAASEDLGIQNPAVLPKAYAETVVARFHSQPEGGEPAAMGIIAERQKWGAAWPAVWQQLAPDLPAGAFVIGMGMSVEPARRLAEVSTVKMEDLRASLPTDTTPKDLGEKVRGALDDALLSYAGQPGADKLSATLLDSAERLAIRYRAAGKSVGDAADQAAREVFNERYAFENVGDAVIRVPRPYDGGDVKAALRLATGDLKRTGQPRVDESSWTTLPDDSGVALTWMGGLVDGPDGQPIVHTWDELLNRSATLERVSDDDRRKAMLLRRAP